MRALAHLGETMTDHYRTAIDFVLSAREREQREACKNNPICVVHKTNTCPCAVSAGLRE